jgi:signal transduction histidine kinase
LLVIDTDTQRYVGSSYFNLLVTLIVFIAIIALLIQFLHQSLTRSLKREAEGTFFSHAYMIAQDEERSRISRELHDTIIQDMRYLLLETEKIGNTDEKNEREKLSGKTVPMMAGLIRKTRDMCNNLIPPDFRFSELPDALRQLCLDFGEKTGIDCRAEIEGDIKLEFLTMEKRLQVFRIVQEALANIEKHAQAKEAIVTMRSGQNGAVCVGIGDDGKGFISPLDRNGQIISGIDKSHIGIISMKERAAILGGSLRIESEPGEGALVCLEFAPPQKDASNGSIVN